MSDVFYTGFAYTNPQGQVAVAGCPAEGCAPFERKHKAERTA